MTLETTNFLLALGTLAMQIATISLLALFFLRRAIPDFQNIATWVGSYALPLAFITSLGGSAMTLYYSGVLGIEPCALCWWQRVFLYPQVILFGTALARSNYMKTVLDTSIALSVIGATIALYHHLLQILPTGALPCPAVGVSCAQRFVFEFGYITFPLMAFSLFLFLIVLMLYARQRSE